MVVAALRIPRVELLTEIGRGAHSVVYRARRGDSEFAVKVPRAEALGDDAVVLARRFLREAAVLARLKHSALPAVLEVGTSDGTPFLIMELAAGDSLATILEVDRLTPAEVRQLGRQLASALTRIHGAGLVHRDIKPHNIIYDQRTGRACLIDFGLARQVSAERVAGTPAYLAPELGGVEVLQDARSDIYALGCVLFEALTARRFSAEMPIRRTDELAKTEAPASLIAVIRKLTERNPRDRYQNTSEVLRDLVGTDESVRTGADFLRPIRALGRHDELRQLKMHLSACQSTGRVAILHGAAGAGKTHLIEALLAESDCEAKAVFRTACPPQAVATFSGVRELFDSYLARLDDFGTVERAEAVSEFRKMAGGMGSLLKLMSPRLGVVFRDAPTLPKIDNVEHLFTEGLADVLRRMLARGPSIVFVDDAQWLDSTSQGVLRRLLDFVGELPALFLFALRDLDDAEAFRGPLALPPAEIHVGPLPLNSCFEIAKTFLSASELDPEIGEIIGRLTDGTPLMVIELLRSWLDQGAIRPHWGRWLLDRDATAVADLPVEISAILSHRLDRLPATTRRFLADGAVIGDAFADALVMAASGMTKSQLAQAIADATQRQLVVEDGPGRYRFVHHSVREALLAKIDAAARREAHQRLAEVLDDGLRVASGIRFGVEAPGDRATEVSHLRPIDNGAAFARDALYELATHYASGTIAKSPKRTFEVNLLAARQAFEALESERALYFLRAVEESAGIFGGEVPIDVRFSAGDAHLRTGAHGESLDAFEAVLMAAKDGVLRASAWLRISFIYHLQLDSQREWEALKNGFAALGEVIPGRGVTSLARSINALTRVRKRSRRGAVSDAEQRHLEVHCSLLYQVARFAQLAAKPEILLLATLEVLDRAERLGESTALVKAYTLYAYALTVTGFDERGAAYIDRADEIAHRLNDPVAKSHVVQLRSIASAWAGRLRDSVEQAAQCIRDYGPWRELGDFCWLCYNQSQILAGRGCNRAAWQALLPAILRIHQHRGAPAVLELVTLGAEATLQSLGRETEAAQLLERVRAATVPIPQSSMFHIIAYAARVRRYTESMRLDDEFEQFVASFEERAEDPRKVHLVLSEYYVHVAHARVHQVLRAGKLQRPLFLRRLRKASKNLRRTARSGLVHAHAAVVDAYLSWFTGKSAKAEREFREAARLGEAEEAPWVLYAVHRGRAHMLASEGHVDAAHDQALVAFALAKEHGAVYRMKWVQEEFTLRPFEVSTNWGSSSPMATVTQDALTVSGARARRQLRALLRISRARAHELDPDHQARIVVDELVHGLRARRGLLLLREGLFGRTEGTRKKIAGLATVCARDGDGHDLQDRASDLDETLIREAFSCGASASSALLVEGANLALPASIGATAKSSTIAAPLVASDEVTGVVYLDRDVIDGAFTDADAEVLVALASQVSVVLELSRSLHLRESAEESRRGQEKMEAIGRLSASIAHDLNNMLAAIRYATAAILTNSKGDAVRDDVRVIQSAARRAEELTRQLRAFARGEFARKEVVWLNDRIRRFLPMLKGLLGEHVDLDVQLSDDVEAVIADPDQLDQIITNLVVNARDAMPNGGRLAIRSTNVQFGQEYARVHPKLRPGRYVEMSVSDTGSGMSPETISRIFEPFFTTKGDRGGTGLGLASVYAMVDKARGHIEVSSEPNCGSTFRVYWPSQGVMMKANVPRGHNETILVVESDPSVCTELEEKLLSLGYAVIACRSGREALQVVKDGAGLRLVVVNALMRGLNFLDLAGELAKLDPRPRVLHVARDTGGVVAERGILGESVEFLPVPVSTETLGRRVRELLEG